MTDINFVPFGIKKNDKGIFFSAHTNNLTTFLNDLTVALEDIFKDINPVTWFMDPFKYLEIQKYRYVSFAITDCKDFYKICICDYSISKEDKQFDTNTVVIDGKTFEKKRLVPFNEIYENDYISITIKVNTPYLFDQVTLLYKVSHFDTMDEHDEMNSLGVPYNIAKTHLAVVSAIDNIGQMSLNSDDMYISSHHITEFRKMLEQDSIEKS